MLAVAQGLYPFGDLKNQTMGFPKAELEAHCGPEQGDWAVMSSVLQDGNPVYGIAHRRGMAVHTYISTHGSTKRGHDQQHKESVDEKGHLGPPRKCPRILNDWTKVQPWSDKNNLFRQHTLAIEERFPTHSFPFRLQTTVIVGMSLASAYSMYQYFVKKDEFDDFLEFVNDLAMDAMLNTYDEQRAARPAPGARDDARAPFVSPPPLVRLPDPLFGSGGSAEFVRGPCELGSIRAVVGWRGNAQQWCGVCGKRSGKKSSHCCLTCSTATALVPVHSSETCPSCFSKHKRAPEDTRRCHASAGRSAAAKKRSKQQCPFTRPRPDDEDE